MKWKIVLIMFTVSVVNGCADTHQLVRLGESTGAHLSPNASVYIAVPQDGVYGDEKYIGSGRTTSQVLLASFAKHANRVEMGSDYQTYEKALAQSKEMGYEYLVYPAILHWEDRATEWSGIPDRVEVKVQVIEVDTKRVAEAVVIKGKSGLATFGGDHPQDLLPSPVEQFVSSLFQ